MSTGRQRAGGHSLPAFYMYGFDSMTLRLCIIHQRARWGCMCRDGGVYIINYVGTYVHIMCTMQAELCTLDTPPV